MNWNLFEDKGRRVVSCMVPVGTCGCCSRREGARTSGKDGELGRPHTLAIIPTSSVLEFIVHEQ